MDLHTFYFVIFVTIEEQLIVVGFFIHTYDHDVTSHENSFVQEEITKKFYVVSIPDIIKLFVDLWIKYNNVPSREIPINRNTYTVPFGRFTWPEINFKCTLLNLRNIFGGDQCLLSRIRQHPLINPIESTIFCKHTVCSECAPNLYRLMGSPTLSFQQLHNRIILLLCLVINSEQSEECIGFTMVSFKNRTIGIEINFQEKKNTARLSMRLITVLIIYRLYPKIFKNATLIINEELNMQNNKIYLCTYKYSFVEFSDLISVIPTTHGSTYI
ncbi:hypothetical protein AGLY_009533 [Aphis glycines]|uniref:Uncharacterized protein n=1 Tax=Aphis glycines TaxID=307491 RepID=A0A6G0TI41_APHGL|nr:hypothetical protein AGLY_009533 [Aphis glycines]